METAGDAGKVSSEITGEVSGVERMIPDKLQKSFIWGRSVLMAAAKADNHAGSFLPFVCAWNRGSFRQNADTDHSKPDRCFSLGLSNWRMEASRSRWECSIYSVSTGCKFITSFSGCCLIHRNAIRQMATEMRDPIGAASPIGYSVSGK